MARGYLAEGNTIVGYELRPGRAGPREWSQSEGHVARFLRKYGLKLDDFKPRSLLSVAAAEKLLKQRGVTGVPFDTITQRPQPSGVKLHCLTPDEHAGQPAAGDSLAQRVVALGEKLSAATGR